jgi:hypothetical protein
MLVSNAKKIALFAIAIAQKRFSGELEKQQEVVMCLSDIVMEVFAMESTLLRTRKLVASGQESNATDMCSVFLRDAMNRIEISARTVVGSCSDRDTLPKNMSKLRVLSDYDPLDTVTLRRNVSARLLAAGSYAL